MKSLNIILFCLILVCCNHKNLLIGKAFPKSIHIPDTTNNLYAKHFDYPYYLIKTEIAKQLKLENLETDTSSSEIRIWKIGSNYHPQKIITLKNRNNIWTIAVLTYYLNHKGQNAKVKVDSISTRGKNEREISLNEFTLLMTDQIWQLPSQSEMKNGGSYGCMDGYALLIEMNSKEKYKYLFYMCPDLHVSKDSTFQTVVTFTNNVAKLIAGTNLSN